MGVHQIAFDGQSYRLEAPEGDWIGAALESGRPYEPHLVRWAARFAEPGAEVVDAGAYIGNHAIYWALRLGATVHAFEPNPAAVDLLRRNIETCGVRNLVEVHEIALGESAGSASLAGHTGENFGSERIELGDGTITVRPLDELELSPGLIKIDVEGLEAKVIQGARETIQRCRPVLIVEDNAPRSIRPLLRKMGYRRVPLNAAWTPTFVYAPNLAAFRKVAATAPYRYILRRRLWRLARRVGLR